MNPPSEEEIWLAERARILWSHIGLLRDALKPMEKEHGKIAMKLLDIRRANAVVTVIGTKIKSDKKDDFISLFNDLTPEQKAQFRREIDPH